MLPCSTSFDVFLLDIGIFLNYGKVYSKFPYYISLKIKEIFFSAILDGGMLATLYENIQLVNCCQHSALKKNMYVFLLFFSFLLLFFKINTVTFIYYYRYIINYKKIFLFPKKNLTER